MKNYFYPTTIAIKTSYLNIDNTTSNENFDTADLKNIYFEKGEIPEKYKDYYNSFHEFFNFELVKKTNKNTKIGGELRILIEFPKLYNYESCVSEDKKIVYIFLDDTNLKYLINENLIPIIKDIMTNKEKYVSSSSSHCKTCLIPGHYSKTCVMNKIGQTYKKNKENEIEFEIDPYNNINDNDDYDNNNFNDDYDYDDVNDNMSDE